MAEIEYSAAIVGLKPVRCDNPAAAPVVIWILISRNSKRSGVRVDPHMSLAEVITDIESPPVAHRPKVQRKHPYHRRHQRDRVEYSPLHDADNLTQLAEEVASY